MIFYFILIISFFLLAFFIRYYRSVFYGLARNSVTLVDEFLSGYSDDDEKIEQVQNKTYRLFRSLLKLFLVILLALFIGAIPITLFVFLSQNSWGSLDFSSIGSIVAISAGATLPFIIPFSPKKNTNYSELSQLLHEIALDNYNLSKKLFRRETRQIKKKGIKKRQDFLIITGLARAGTTSLMNDLAKIDAFVSLSYANMPFLLAPNTWARIYMPKNQKLEERSHKDGIMIGYNSNEALEEYFFKVFANDSYILDDRLEEYSLSSTDYNDYLDYQTIIRKDNQKIYLAKNNNFLLRYRSIRSFNKDFIIVILFRDPLTHAASLMEKHRYYQETQDEDPFVLKYMDWLGHHEFGKNQKPFDFNGSVKSLEYEKDSLDYWLQSWINYYRFVLEIDHTNTLLVNYEDYCKNPEATIRRIVDKTGLNAQLAGYSPFENKRKNSNDFSADLYQKADEIYQELLNRSS